MVPIGRIEETGQNSSLADSKTFSLTERLISAAGALLRFLPPYSPA